MERLHQFRELRRTIRGNKSILVVGIDIAKERHYAFFGTADGRTLKKRLIFGNGIQDFNGLLSLASDLQAQNSLSRCPHDTSAQKIDQYYSSAKKLRREILY